jgi:ABC-type branched-subunit amino acid transport system substrate-binding protein
MIRVVWLLCALIMAGCALQPDAPRYRIALLAPFEGRSREIGYEALYAARLALTERDSRYDLLPIDDGGTSASALERARALARDPAVLVIIVLGDHAATPAIIAALDDLPAVTLANSATRPLDSDFARRYTQSDVFAPPLTDLAIWTYDAVHSIIAAGGTTRAQVADGLRKMS